MSAFSERSGDLQVARGGAGDPGDGAVQSSEHDPNVDPNALRQDYGKD